MYIRRKVFSLLQDENGEERYFSTTEFEDERLYAESDDDEKSGKGKKAAIIGGAAVAPVAVAGGYQLVRGRKRAEKNWKKLSEKVNEAGGLENMGAEAEKINNQMLKASARKRSNKVDKFGDDVQVWVKNAPKKAVKWVKETWKGENTAASKELAKAQEKLKNGGKVSKKRLAELEKKA